MFQSSVYHDPVYQLAGSSRDTSLFAAFVTLTASISATGTAQLIVTSMDPPPADAVSSRDPPGPVVRPHRDGEYLAGVLTGRLELDRSSPRLGCEKCCRPRTFGSRQGECVSRRRVLRSHDGNCRDAPPPMASNTTAAAAANRIRVDRRCLATSVPSDPSTAERSDSGPAAPGRHAPDRPRRAQARSPTERSSSLRHSSQPSRWDSSDRRSDSGSRPIDARATWPFGHLAAECAHCSHPISSRTSRSDLSA